MLCTSSACTAVHQYTLLAVMLYDLPSNAMQFLTWPTQGSGTLGVQNPYHFGISMLEERPDSENSAIRRSSTPAIVHDGNIDCQK